MSVPTGDVHAQQKGGIHFRRRDSVLQPWNGVNIGGGALESENIDKNAALMPTPLLAARGVFSQASSALRALFKRNSGAGAHSDELAKSSPRTGELELENAAVVVVRAGPIQSNVKLKAAKIPQFLSGHSDGRSDYEKSSGESISDKGDLSQVLSLSFGGCAENGSSPAAQFAFVKV